MGPHARHYTSKAHRTLQGYTWLLWQPHKLASSVNLYRFTHFLDFLAGSIFANCLLGEASPSPFERYLRYRLHDFRSFYKKQNFSFSSLQQKSDDRKITKWGTPTFSGITAIITLLSVTNRSVARSCHSSQGEVVQR